MASGPEHYLIAEQLLWLAGVDTKERAYREVQLDEPPSPLVVAAQVHATLALAAATALGAGQASAPGMLGRDAKTWLSVAGEPRETLAGVR